MYIQNSLTKIEVRIEGHENLAFKAACEPEEVAVLATMSRLGAYPRSRRLAYVCKVTEPSGDVTIYNFTPPRYEMKERKL